MNNKILWEDIIERGLLSSQELYSSFDKSFVLSAVEMISKALHNKHKILICGNGGSAADAQHMAAEFVGRFLKERMAFPAIALTTDSSILTAIGNDYGFDSVFERQVEALCKPGDILFAISTSGNSQNIYKAILKAKQMGAAVIALLGRNGGICESEVDMKYVVRSNLTARIQEIHMFIEHLICELVEFNLFGDE